MMPCLAISLFAYDPVVRDVIFIMFFIGIYAALGVTDIAAREGWTRRALCSR